MIATTLAAHPLHPLFGAEIAGLDLRGVHDRATLEAIRRALDTYAVCVFPDQSFEDDDQIAFAQRFDGQINTTTGRSAVETARRLPSELMTDISNLDEHGKIMDAADYRRVQALANRLWHTDTAFTDPPGRYSMLYAHGPLPPTGGETEFADMRAAYDALPGELKEQIAGLRAHHSIVYSRQTIGFDDYTPEQRAMLKGADHPLVRVNPRTGRTSLYIASHASHVVGWPVPEGRLLLRELMALATLPQFVYRHAWRERELVIWDNLATMHRGRAYDESYVRDMRRVTTLDVPLA